MLPGPEGLPGSWLRVGTDYEQPRLSPQLRHL